MSIERPEKFPEWARVEYIDPTVGGNSVIEPSEQKKDKGWARNEKPPANIQNWLQKLTNEWLQYLDSVRWQTGDRKFTDRVTADPGWIMYTEDGTIGSLTSGATIRANDDTKDLFIYYWTYYDDAKCPVDGGRGGLTPEQGWAANKRLHPPKHYGRVSAAVGSGDIFGTVVGAKTHALIASENGQHDHPGVLEITSAQNAQESGGGDHSAIQYNTNGTTGLSGTGSPHNNMQPTYYCNVMIKL